jgi:S1-C subfamily serine protease
MSCSNVSTLKNITNMKKNKVILLTILFVSMTSYGQTVTDIANIGINSTVSIIALDQTLQPLAYGSGFIIADELIVTNVHVIEGSSSAYVLLNGQEKKYSVSGYVAIDKINDLVILKVSGLNGSKLNLGSEIFPEIGEKIYAVGNPKGLNGTFSEGIISGIRNLTTNQILQITAPISPGSSGGPVLNSFGQVVGIAFASFSVGQNLNFAIPVKYLITLNSKIGTMTPLSTVKAQPKTTTTETINTNIKEGVSVRNIEPCFECGPTMIFFSIKNNLSYTVSDIKILFLVYDGTGTIVDYIEGTYFEWIPYSKEGGIKPSLAKSIDFYSGHAPQVTLKYGYKVKARVLDFKIIEE